MEIEEMKKRKVAAEQSIANILNEFEEATLLRVSYIGFDRGIEMSRRGSFIFDVKLDIKI